MDSQKKKRQRCSNNLELCFSRSLKKSRHTSPVKIHVPIFSRTPSPVPNQTMSTILLGEILNEIKEQKELLSHLESNQKELEKNMKTIMTSMGLDSQPDNIQSEYNYYI